NFKGETPMNKAAGWAKMDIIRLLMIFGANANITDDSGATSLDKAAELRNRDAIEFLLAHDPAGVRDFIYEPEVEDGSSGGK
ncbi:MAG: ankyrin repeat domain-containing protein, partial [Nitrospiria bacterium]